MSVSADVLCNALQRIAGPFIVVDRDSIVLHATPDAVAWFGEAVATGAAFPADRALAAALATTNEARTRCELAIGGEQQLVEVRVIALHERRAVVGHVLAFGGREPVATRATETEFQGMWTRDPAMLRVFHVIRRAAARDVGVLVRGPTGAGKELVARAIHTLSHRAKGPFKAVNCAALPPTLLESELFGHVKGAFTGAVRDSPGIFRAAHRGTLFLDEVAEMPLDLQAKLLRVLETRTVIPLGTTEPLDVDARIVAATHQSLRAAVAAGRFRADLMYRLRIVPIFLPPLAARVGDVELLARRFIDQLNGEGERRVDSIAPGALEALLAYAWPGNVRELHSALEYAFVVGEGPVLIEGDLPPEITGAAIATLSVERAPDVKPLSEDAQRIVSALTSCCGNREDAARALGISRATLWRRMRAYGLLHVDEVE